MNKGNHIGANVYTVFYKGIANAITLHRALLTLCESGWTQVTAILLRTIMECSANCLAIINNQFPEYMAFKYIYHPWIQIIRDDNYPKNIRDKAKTDLDQGIENLKDEALKKKAIDYAFSEKLNIFWFKPEESGVSSIIKEYGSDELKFVYGSLSMSAHAGHLGMNLFKDDSDDIGIDPSDNPKKNKLSLLLSCRLLLELLYIRNVAEKLGYDSKYHEFLDKILEFDKEVRG